MWDKPCFRSSVGHDVVDNKFTVSSLFCIAVGFILLREVTDLQCYSRNPKSTSKIDFWSGGSGGGLVLLSS